DISIYYIKVKLIKLYNLSYLVFKLPNIIYIKAYNYKKDLFRVIFNNYKLFNLGSLLLLAFNKEIFKDLANIY
ncbi:uncharacterized protein BKA55DRAFT_530074, partial [Fusarium redolens]